MGAKSRRKGVVGELELAAFLRDQGIEARRGVQFHGGADSPDVVTSLYGVHFECKRVEAGNLYDWLAQAKEDAGSSKMPVVAHRRNNQDWVAILPLGDLLSLLKATRMIPNGLSSV